jgi:hypothetical protein
MREGVAGGLPGARGPTDRGRMLLALQRSAGNAAVNRLLRQVAPPSLGSEAPSAVLVADDATPGPAQRRKTEFLNALEPVLCEIAERRLGSRAVGCPWIEHWIGYYRERSVGEVADAVARYAPTAVQAKSAEGLMSAICERVEEGIAAWQSDTKVAFKLREDASPPSADAADVVGRLGPGRPLDGAVRARMGAAMGADFGGVHVHDDPASAHVTRTLGAHALAVGDHIAFAPNRYEPGTPIGDALIAHELAHVIQQREGPGLSRTAALEADADQAAVSAVHALHGGPPGARGLRPALRGGLRLQRCGDKTKEVEATKSAPAPVPAPPPGVFDPAAGSQAAAHAAFEAYKKLAAADRRKEYEKAQKNGTLGPALKALGAEEASEVFRDEVREVLRWVQEDATRAFSGMDDAKMADVEAKWVYKKNQTAAAAAKGGGPVTDAEIETERQAQEQAKSYYKPMARTRYDSLKPPQRKWWDKEAKKAIDKMVAYANTHHPEIKLTAANLVWAPNSIDSNAPGALGQGGGPGKAEVGFEFVKIVKVNPAYAMSTVVHELLGHPEHDPPSGGNYSLALWQLAGAKIPGYVQDPTAEATSYDYHESEIYSLVRELPYWTKVSAKDIKWDSVNYDPRSGMESQLDDIIGEWEPKLAAAIVHGLYKRFEMDPRVAPMGLKGFSDSIKAKFPAEHASIVK